ncbi:MAG TPA: tetratricopeptide repeat protein [Casimicrobiaceae bacterium]|nr:tetratricopeptide repeat protein [Casimicrobiaceae bacterium]
MSAIDAAWELRIATLWSAIDDYEPAAFVAEIDALAAELPPTSAVGQFERASAQDSTGHPDLAVPLYRAALDAGLTGLRRRRATIQLASSLRNLGSPVKAVELLAAEANQPSDELDGAVRAFLALALADLGREREALATSLDALSRYLPRYNRSLARYARELVSRRDEP